MAGGDLTLSSAISRSASCALALVVLLLTLASKDVNLRPISSLVLSTGLGPDGRPLLPPQPVPMCIGSACQQAASGAHPTQTMLGSIKKVLRALDNKLGDMKISERDWKSTMTRKVRTMGQKVRSLRRVESKIYGLQQDVEQKLARPGPVGKRGLPGYAGRTGITGPLGPLGATGPQGIDGVQGQQGIPGIMGAPGIGYGFCC